MKEIKRDEIMITYDDELGIVYTPQKGILQTTSSKHAKNLKQLLQKYLNKELNEDEKEKLERYIYEPLKDYNDLPVAELYSLFERRVLRRMEIIITNECNLRCKYCYAHGGSYDMKIQSMTPESATLYLEKLLVDKFQYVEYITFFGGEPTLCQDTIKTVCEFFESNVQKRTFKKMPRFLMVSNGTLINESIAEIIKKYNIGMTISIDGPKEINDFLRIDSKGNGCFDKVAYGIDLLINKGIPPLLLEATYTSQHKKQGYSKENVREYLKQRFQVSDIMVADCCGNLQENELVYVDDEVHDYEIVGTESELISFVYKCLTSGKYIDHGCDVCYGAYTLTPNGEIYPCHFL